MTIAEDTEQFPPASEAEVIAHSWVLRMRGSNVPRTLRVDTADLRALVIEFQRLARAERAAR